MRNRLPAAVFVATITAASAAGLTALRVGAQAPGADPAFEAASIKPNKGADGRVAIMFQPGGRLVANGVTLRQLIAMAYGTGQLRPDSEIIGGPSWIASDRFDVVAKAEGDLPPPGSGGFGNQMFLMIRTMLRDRFKLVTHMESRDMPIYALVLAQADGKLGPHMVQSTTDCAALFRGRGPGGPPVPPAPGERPPCGMRNAPGNISGGSATMSMLTTVLSRAANRIVVDKTGLTGTYDVDLTYTPDQMPQLPPGGPPPGAPPFPPIDPNGPSLFTAVQEQLGLKLDSQRGPVEVIVVDSADHPTEN